MLFWHCEEEILLCFCTVCTAQACWTACPFMFRVQVVTFLNCLEYGGGNPRKILSLRENCFRDTFVHNF